MGRNIPCDLHNEHVNKLLKGVIVNMGANLTEKALQRAARSISALQLICKKFDHESGVLVGTQTHSTRSDRQDIVKVTNAVIRNNLLTVIPGRKHSAFLNMSMNPLWNWDTTKTRHWIEKKKKEMIK